MSKHIGKVMVAMTVVVIGARTAIWWANETRGQPAPVGAIVARADAPDAPERDALQMVRDGRQTFRFDTFGDEAFWGDALQLHRAIAGEKLGGVGPGVGPATALAVGLKVDADALPRRLLHQLKRGQVDLEDPAATLALLKLDAV